VAPDLEPDTGAIVTDAAMEIRGQRLVGGEALDDPDVADRIGRRISLLITLRERVPITLEQRLPAVRPVATDSASMRPSVQLRTMPATALSSAARSGSGVFGSIRPMMKCTRTSGPSGKNGKNALTRPL